MREVKKCKCCGDEKEFIDFYINKNTKDGLDTYCKKCRIKQVGEYRKTEKGKKKHIEYVNKSRLKHSLVEKNTKPKIKKSRNIYFLEEDYVVVNILDSQKNLKAVFLIDFNDIHFVENYTWYLSKDGYVITNIKGKRKSLHRLLLDAIDGVCVDHISGDKLDNRKNNLRKCTQQQNAFNHKTYNTNSSGICGVSWDNKRRKWTAYIKVNYKSIRLGDFDDKEDAVKVRKIAEDKYFKDFARSNIN